jgi:hypothetical protein
MTKETEQDVENIWLPLMKTNGEWDEQKIKNELHDLVFCVKQIGKIYSHITGGMLSKPTYYASTIIAELDELNLDKKITQEDVSQMIEDSENKEELIKQLKEYFEL